MHTVHGGGGLSPARCGPETPAGVGLETPPARPLNFPLGWAWRLPWRPAGHAGIPPARHAGIQPPKRPAAMHAGIPPPPPMNRITDTCKNITLPQLSLQAAITITLRQTMGTFLLITERRYCGWMLMIHIATLWFCRYFVSSQKKYIQAKFGYHYYWSLYLRFIFEFFFKEIVYIVYGENQVCL